MIALGLVVAQSGAAVAAYSAGGTETVAAQDDYFDAEAVHVPVGTTVQWKNTGRNPHTVTADDGSTDSGNLGSGQEFTVTFAKPTAFTYFCRYHGSAGGIGMSRVIVVGKAKLPSHSGLQVGAGRESIPQGEGSVITVPQQYSTIQQAVDGAKPGDLIVVSPGVYHEAVKVTTPYLTIVGTDRNQVILEGDFKRPNGIHVIEADGWQSRT
jgi:plastocyanin